MTPKEQHIRDNIITDYMEHIAPSLENVLKRFGEITPNNPPKFLRDFHDLFNKKIEAWTQGANSDEQKFIADIFNEYMSYQVASFLHANPKSAVAVEKAKNLMRPTPEAVPVPVQAQTSAASIAPAAPAAVTQPKEKGKGLKALQNIVKAGGEVLSAFFSYKPPKVVTDVSNLTEFALGVIFGTAKGAIQKLREEAKLSQSLQNLKNEVTNGYLSDISPKLIAALERYDDILSTPGQHPLLTELNTSIADKMQRWTANRTAEEQQFISKTFSALLRNQTASILAKNPTLAQRIDADKTLLQEFGIPTEAIHPDIATLKKSQEWTPELAEQAVKEDGNSLKSIPEQLVTEQLCKIAISGENGKGEALQHVPDKFKTSAICDAAMQKNPAQAFLYVPDIIKTPEMCDKAVTATGENLQHVPKNKISQNLCETAVKNFGKSFAYVPKDLRNAALCLAAVKVDGTNLQHVPDSLKTKKLCTEAQKHTTQDISKFFPKKFAAAEKAQLSKSLQTAIKQIDANRVDAPKQHVKTALKVA
jgi:hypothetical protein